MSGSIRVDWQAIKARWGSEVSEFHLALVPKGFAQLVLAVQERLQWEATYRIDDYDFADWDTLQAIVDAGLAGLTDTMRLSDLLGYLDEIEPLLQQIRDNQVAPLCCDQVSVLGETIDSEIVPDVGDPPTVWGNGEPVADWDDWRQIVCGAANSYVDLLIERVNELEIAAGGALATIGFIAAILGVMSGAGIIITIKYLVAYEAFIAFVNSVDDFIWDDIRDGLEAARSDIRCSVFEGCGDLASAIETAVGSVGWLGLFQFIDYCSARNAMLEGSHGAEYLDVNRLDECACDGVPTPEFSELTLFGSSRDGHGNWSDGQQVDSTQVRYRSTKFGSSALTRSLPAGYRVAGNVIRLTLQLRELADGVLTKVDIDYGGSNRFAATRNLTGSCVEHVFEHTITTTDVTSTIGIYLYNDAGATNHAACQALIEVFGT